MDISIFMTARDLYNVAFTLYHLSMTGIWLSTSFDACDMHGRAVHKVPHPSSFVAVSSSPHRISSHNRTASSLLYMILNCKWVKMSLIQCRLNANVRARLWLDDSFWQLLEHLPGPGRRTPFCTSIPFFLP